MVYAVTLGILLGIEYPYKRVDEDEVFMMTITGIFSPIVIPVVLFVGILYLLGYGSYYLTQKGRKLLRERNK